MPYIHELHDWPNFTWNPETVLAPLGTYELMESEQAVDMSQICPKYDKQKNATI